MNVKKLLIVLLLLFVFPFIVNAETDSCKAITGTGKNIGDEIVCGSEHFYIIEISDNKVKLLTKYNLYVGEKIEKDTETFVVENPDEDYIAYGNAEARCDTLIDSNKYTDVELTGKYTEGEVPDEFFCRMYSPLEYTEVKQSELAIGLYPNANKEIVYPIYGSLYLDEEVGDKEFDENLDMIPETSQFNTYLTGYKETLTKIGVNVLDIGYIKRSGIESFINNVSEKKLTIPTYNPEDISIDPSNNMWEPDEDRGYDLFFYKFNIKEYVPENYKWLYGTSYWVGSATYDVDNDYYYDEFLSTVGDYCSYSRGCHIRKMGLGLRPVITINNSDIAPLEEIIDNPKTGSNLSIYLLCGSISLLGLVGVTLYVTRKKDLNNN